MSDCERLRFIGQMLANSLSKHGFIGANIPRNAQSVLDRSVKETNGWRVITNKDVALMNLEFSGALKQHLMDN